MILPSKHLTAEKALLTVGSELLVQLRHSRTVSGLWDSVRKETAMSKHLSYDWFVLALDLLFMIGAIQFEDGVVSKAGQ